MLRSTFAHLRGCGDATEGALHRDGLRTWDEFLTAASAGRLRLPRRQVLLPGVEDSTRRFERGEWAFFDRAVPARHKWRAFGELGARAVYVDIETDGRGAEGENVTVIGAWDGRRLRQFVAGRDLDQALEYLESFPLVVTYNGAAFDLPVIRRRFRYHLFNHVHVDLLFPCRALGLRGGLKRVEEQAGITRAAATRGLDGWDAVRLWREHAEGRAGALELLLAYNAEDVRNLQPLMHLTYNAMKARLGQAADA